MDTRTPSPRKEGAAQWTNEQRAAIERGLQTIKTRMPSTYQSIQSKAAEIGNDVFRLVRHGLAGSSCCFYAVEGGHVVGTPFTGHPVEAATALTMVQFGSAHVCIYGESINTKGGDGGAH